VRACVCVCVCESVKLSRPRVGLTNRFPEGVMADGGRDERSLRACEGRGCRVAL
jgi:hypothetical protein